MTINYKILGQIYPNSGSMDILYQVPISSSALVTSLIITNQTSSATDFTVAVIPSGSLITNKNYIYFNIPILSNDAFESPLSSLAISQGDRIIAGSSNGKVSFNLFGQEITQ